MPQPAPTAYRRRARAAVGLAGAAVLVGLSGAPAAAATVAQASGTAVRVTAGGVPADSGSFTSTHDGRRESTSGSSTPMVSVLTGQDLLTAGTLAQDARTRVEDGRGYAVACAGLAGDGATIVAAGEGTCLRGGQNLQLSAGTFDLSQLRIVESPLFMGADGPLQDLSDQLRDQLVGALQDSLVDGVEALGDPGLFLELGAVQSSCTSGPGTASGRADLADVAAYAQLAGERVDLLRLPASPPPNTRVGTDLGALSTEIRGALREQLTTGLDGALADLGVVVDEAAVLDEALAQIGEQLAPLEDNVLDIVLNAQTRAGADQITVTALDARVLPVAAGQIGGDPLRLQVGESACGPSGRVAAPAPDPDPDPQPTPRPDPAPQPAPRTPTAVPAGVASAPDDGLSGTGLLALGGLVVLAVAAGVGRRGPRTDG